MHLSKITINNFRGIEFLEVSFDPKLNILIGENGCCKTAVIDAIRLLYNLGNQKRYIYVETDDFFFKPGAGHTKKIEIKYCFQGLSPSEKGALYEYLIVDPGDPLKDFAQITLCYEYRDKGYPKFTYFTGSTEEQKADSGTFDIFQHYYLGALRDSTADLLNVKTNVLGSVIKRLVDRTSTHDEFRKIIKTANDELLKRPEVLATRTSVNSHLDDIFKISKDNKIGLRIEESSKIESIVNIIRPYLPHDKSILENDGFNLWQNSLGFNNLIYIAIILGDISERLKDNPSQHFALLIEEPEAHLHPQLQLNLYNFLKAASAPPNCQLFITSHSPSLTSKSDLDNIIVLKNSAINIGSCFLNREGENIIEQATKKIKLTDSDFLKKKKQLERYLDVTKSQLFFARGILFVEGISEKLLIKSFAEYIGLKIDDHRSEIISVDGISFYPFIHLFNSIHPEKCLPHKAAIITDDDRFAKEKQSFKTLTKKNFNNLDTFHAGLYKSNAVTRIGNISSALGKPKKELKLFTAFKTLEYEIALANISATKSIFTNNLLIKFIADTDPEKFKIIETYFATIKDENLKQDEIQKLAILVWKALPSKAEFAQTFSQKLEDAIERKTPFVFNVPNYIINAIKHSVN